MENNERLKKEAAFQDNRVETGDENRFNFQFLIPEERQIMEDSLEDIEGKRILTMGCSTGGVTPYARRGAMVYGVDISIASLKFLNKAVKKENLEKNTGLIAMNCEELGFKNEFFDIILFFGVLHHLEIQRTLMECKRVLKKEGMILLAEPLGLHPIIKLYRYFTPKMRTEFEHPLKPADFKMFKKHFTIEKFDALCLTSIFSIVFYALNQRKTADFTRKLLTNIDHLIFRLVPWSKYLAWTSVVKLRKPEI